MEQMYRLIASLVIVAHSTIIVERLPTTVMTVANQAMEAVTLR